MSEWRKSSYSASQSDCVEVGTGVGIRDSKAPDQHISLSARSWREFLDAVKQVRLASHEVSRP
ncbi:hypothetical protein Lesp02_77630 [Lentzea sp. NBRC 105346]|uniref:DUF397 domain-containing protein n=1 Tax=Lentzea sp. NBRC 105346 TaxID=3032205 RepID=UPI0024A31B9A|nr:DUF397 domain-containing protein [Lentzea sp. NBRC 105346]GLZ35576.1 hypothetical protein Lesp02_77630 [Lentzea sp. NBRC 105346]